LFSWRTRGRQDKIAASLLGEHAAPLRLVRLPHAAMMLLMLTTTLARLPWKRIRVTAGALQLHSSKQPCYTARTVGGVGGVAQW